jgi:NitT/TauT family transport system substrate-binding protein
MRRAVAVAHSTCLLAAAAACGADNGSDDQSGSSDKAADKVTVGVIAIVDVAPIYLGKEKGFFSERDIDLTLQAGSGGAVTVAGVTSGQFQFGFGNITSLMVAREKGVPLKVLANGASSTGEAGKDFSGVVVKADSPIKTPADLAGKTVSVNNLKNVGDTTVRASVRKAGGDASSIKFTELPFPEAPAAVANGRVDAAWVVEPFLTTAQNQGLRVVAWNMVDTAPKMTVAAYFSSEPTINKDPDLAKRFTEAMNESLKYATDHPDEARKILAAYTKIPADVAEKITLTGWDTELNRASIEELAKLAQQDGLLAKPADLDGLLGQG